MADVTNYTIENASGANVRTDLNNVFAAIQSSNSKSINSINPIIIYLNLILLYTKLI